MAKYACTFFSASHDDKKAITYFATFDLKYLTNFSFILINYRNNYLHRICSHNKTLFCTRTFFPEHHVCNLDLAKSSFWHDLLFKLFKIPYTFLKSTSYLLILSLGRGERDAYGHENFLCNWKRIFLNHWKFPKINTFWRCFWMTKKVQTCANTSYVPPKLIGCWYRQPWKTCSKCINFEILCFDKIRH